MALLAAGRRRIRDAVYEHPVIFTVSAAYLAWRLWQTVPSAQELEDWLGTEEERECSPVPRRPSFNLTNERGEQRGSLESDSGWGWQVQEAPLAAKVQGGSSLRDSREAR
jgi:hypothetical protein